MRKQHTAPLEEYLSQRGLARALSIPEPTLRKLLKAGQIGADGIAPNGGMLFRSARVREIKADLATKIL